MMAPDGLSLTLPDELVERIAERAAVIVLERLGAEAREAVSPWLTVVEAAAYLRAKPQRVYDLLSAGRLTRHKDGARVLVLREEVDAYLAGERLRRVAPPLPPARRGRLARGLAA